MESRVAVMGIIVDDHDAVGPLNAVLHEYASYVIGRMGVPYRKRDVSVISVALDGPQDVISALAGKVGNIAGVSVKTAYSNLISHDTE